MWQATELDGEGEWVRDSEKMACPEQALQALIVNLNFISLLAVQIWKLEPFKKNHKDIKSENYMHRIAEHDQALIICSLTILPGWN